MRSWFVFASLCLAVACGGADGGALGTGGLSGAAGNAAVSLGCEPAPACGGDPVGTWQIATSCLDIDLSSYTAECDGATARAVDFGVTGTITYDADLTYTLTSTLSGRVVASWPAPCLTPANGIQVTCEQLRAALLAPGTYQSITCVPASSGCTCSLEMNAESSWSEGRYVTDAAGVLTETDSTGSARQRDYCVKDGATMTLSPYPAGALRGMASGPITLMKLSKD
jgi:hypothetical protein